MAHATAPFYREVAGCAKRVESSWLRARDGTRLRLAIWPDGDKGTVLLFPGRTDYIEKYGPTADELQMKGYAVACLDWRGQGLSDRALGDRCVGHVSQFSEYQRDVAAMMDALHGSDLPRPRFLLAHSMGGCIGLRALTEGLDVQAAVFSAPMWGIEIPHLLRPFAWFVAWAARSLRFGHVYVPGTDCRNYVQKVAFERNLLTSDMEMYTSMRHQLDAYPNLWLGGPSLQWLHEALGECHVLASAPSPDIPTVTFLGSDDLVIDHARIHQRMSNWHNGRLVMMAGAKHEPMMEAPSLRRAFFAAATEHFASHQ